MTFPLWRLAWMLLALATAPASARLADHRNREVARCMGDKYGVSAALLLAIRYSECPRPQDDYKACGCKSGGGWVSGGIWGQYAACARTVARRARKHGWYGHRPTRAQVIHLGTHYAEGSTSWGVAVWAQYRRALREAHR
jgi:hypothetical protein